MSAAVSGSFQWSQREAFFLGHKKKQLRSIHLQASVIAAVSVLRLSHDSLEVIVLIYLSLTVEPQN